LICVNAATQAASQFARGAAAAPERGESHAMWERVSDWVVGTLVAVFGAVGLIMGVGARDEEIFNFGFSLALFSGTFIYGIYKRQQAERAAIQVRGGKNV
jgi:hypothetical protein